MSVNYDLMARQIRALAEQEPWYVPLFSNASAVIYANMPEINWAGFYLVRDGALVLGPFQGKAACIHIRAGKGVCGTALAEDRTVLVPDVHAFHGHIACDSASNAEIVVPIHAGGKVAALLDIDSPALNRFTAEDQAGLEKVVKALERDVRFDS